MPKLGLGLGLPTTRVSAAFDPSSIPGLQAFWNMEGAPPEDQIDNSGNGIILSYDDNGNLAPATSVFGKIDNAVSFNATNLPGSMSEGARYYTNSWGVDVENDFTMSVWMAARNFDSYSHIIGAPFQNGFYVGGNDTQLTFNLFNGTLFGVTAPTVTPNTWVHYVFGRSEDNLFLYVNNAYHSAVSVSGETFSNDSVFSVGGGEFNQYFYDGNIDALGIWNVALTEADISKLWNGGAGVQIP